MILDWSYNYHANDMYQQVAPVEIYVKTTTTKQQQQTNKQKSNRQTNTLFAVDKQP